MRKVFVVPGVAVLLLAFAVGEAAAQTTLRTNGRIVFATVDGMASMNSDGTGQWGLRFTRIGETGAAWSPDGATIAFADYSAAGPSLSTMDPDGTNERRLYERYVANPSWSPDGKRIAFDDGVRLYTMNADGTDVTPLGEGLAPDWSPDGRALAYVALDSPDANGRYQVYVLDLASHVRTRLTSGPAGNFAPDWSPDGAHVAFVSDRDGPWSVFTMQRDGTTQTQLTRDAFDSEPDWSPDGSKLVFSRNSQIWVMDGDGSNARQLTRGNAWSASPAWQPLAPAPPECTLWGTRANDLLVATDRRDVVCGLDGDDSLIGLAGNDDLRGGDGRDWLAGGLDVDILRGGAGDDVLDARDAGRDFVAAGEGFDDFAWVDARGLDVRYGAERARGSRNVAAWHPTSASNQEPTNPAVLAVDGRMDDYWSSGGYPTQWLEVDLLAATKVARIRLVAPDLPAETPILVLGRAPRSDTYRLLHQFAGPSVFKQEFEFAPKRPWRGIRYVRLQIPVSSAPVGWVAWPELEVHAAAR